MNKVKIHSLLVASLLISSVSMALYAYQNFKSGEIAYGIVLSVICISLLGMVISGLIKSRLTSRSHDFESE